MVQLRMLRKWKERRKPRKQNHRKGLIWLSNSDPALGEPIADKVWYIFTLCSTTGVHQFKRRAINTAPGGFPHRLVGNAYPSDKTTRRWSQPFHPSNPNPPANNWSKFVFDLPLNSNFWHLLLSIISTVCIIAVARAPQKWFAYFHSQRGVGFSLRRIWPPFPKRIQHFVGKLFEAFELKTLLLFPFQGWFCDVESS